MPNPVIPEHLLQYATPEELAKYERHLELEVALRSPLDYAMHTTPSSVRYQHIELLNAYLSALFEGRLYKNGPGPMPKGFGDDARHPVTGEKPVDQLAISFPPRHGKSYMVSEHTPAWFLTKYPDLSLILASYEADFAAEWGRKARNLVELHTEFGVLVDQQSRASDHWSIKDKRGAMYTAGAGGSITGKGGHVIVIDDPIKNQTEARSETDRADKKDWFISVADTRREPYPITGRLAPIILMATRWHEDDLIGWATRDKPDQWCYINLPALAFTQDEDPLPDLLGRPPGEALCPARYTAVQLEEKREKGDEEGQGLFWFNALYQGRPVVDGAGLFKRPSFLYYEAHQKDSGDVYYTLIGREGVIRRIRSDECFRFQTVDLAASVKTSADFTVISTWDVTKDRDLILVDRIRTRMESPDHAPQVEAEFLRMKPRFIGVEKATYGIALMQQLLRNGRPIRKLEPDKDKVSRAIPAGDLVDNGKVYFPRHAAWLEEWESELVAFDNGTHDDQVDTLAYAVTVMQGLPNMRPAKEPELNTPEARIERKMQSLEKKRRRRVPHPTLGRW